MNILYVEDNATDAQLVSRYINTTSHSLEVVSTMQEALDRLDDSVHILLIDVLLQDERSGIDLAHSVREQGFSQPMIAVTALTTMQDKESIQNAGFDMILFKPFQISELEDVLGQFIV